MDSADFHQSEELARFRLWRRMVLIALVSVLPAECAVGVPLGQRIESNLPFTCIAMSIMVVVVYGGIRMWLFRCPRCHESFIAGFMQISGGAARYTRPLTSKCVNCGLLDSGA